MTPRAATFSVFVVNGAMIGTWVAHIPWLQERLGVSKATIGLVPAVHGGRGADRDAADRPDPRPAARAPSVTRAATLVFCLLLPLPLLATSPCMLGAILFVFGAANGAMDVADERPRRRRRARRSRGRSCPRCTAAGASAASRAAGVRRDRRCARGVDPRVESAGRRRRALAGRALDHRPAGQRVGPLRGGEAGSRCPRAPCC